MPLQRCPLPELLSLTSTLQPMTVAGHPWLRARTQAAPDTARVGVKLHPSPWHTTGDQLAQGSVDAATGGWHPLEPVAAPQILSTFST